MQASSAKPLLDASKRICGLVCALFFVAAMAKAQAQPGPMQQPGKASAGTNVSAPSSAKNTGAPTSRGKRLVLKDGNRVLVREYHVSGDRIRFYNLDASDWEEMPAALVDWDATKKLEAEETQQEESINDKAHTQEEARRMEPLDIDASLEAAPGVFLPPGEGLYVFDGKAVLQLQQALTNSKLSKGRMAEKVLVPIPVVPTRHAISLPGERATMRIRERQPEFYLRTETGIEPQLRLIRAKIQKDQRKLENLDELYGSTMETGDIVPIQKWQVARGVYRFTLGQSLDPGEYAMAEILEEGTSSVYVWDFGVDETAGAGPAKLK